MKIFQFNGNPYKLDFTLNALLSFQNAMNDNPDDSIRAIKEAVLTSCESHYLRQKKEVDKSELSRLSEDFDLSSMKEFKAINKWILGQMSDDEEKVDSEEKKM